MQRLRVWDLPTRLFHWLLVAAITAAGITGEIGGSIIELHGKIGLAIVGLIAFRLAWGVVGSTTARFSSFVRGPAAIRGYLQGAWRGIGHNPLGALSVLGLLGLLAAQVGTGLFANDDIALSGPLARFVAGEWVGRATWFHADVGQYLVIGLVALHLLAIAYYTLVRRKTLVRPMLHGDKDLPTGAPASRDDALSRVAAALVMGACAALAWWVAGLGTV